MGQNSKDSQSKDTLPTWTLHLFEDINGQLPYYLFRDSLNDYAKAVPDICVEEILARQGNNVCNSSWGKPLGKGLFEFRINRSLSAICNEALIPIPVLPSAEKVISLRIFFTVNGSKIILLLGGYNKGRQPSHKRQQSEINIARKHLNQHKRGLDL